MSTLTIDSRASRDGVKEDLWREPPPPSRRSFGRVVKVWAWKFITLPLMGLVYFVVISEGFRILIPVLGTKLSRLPIPGASSFRHYVELRRLDMAHLMALMLCFACWYLWVVNLGVLFAPKEYFARTKFDPHVYSRFVRGLGIVLLGGEAILFYTGISQQMGGMFGGAVFSPAAIIATIVYVAVVIFISFVTVNLNKE